MKTMAEYLDMHPAKVLTISIAMLLAWRVEGIMARIKERL